MLLVLMSLEKCFAVYFPFKSKTVCTVRTVKWATGVVGFILTAYNSVYFFAYASDCFYVFDPGVIKYLDFVNSALYSFGPFIVMFFTNFAVVLKFIAAKCKYTSTHSTNQALSKSATRGTAMVVSVSVTFILLTAPTAVNVALWHYIKLSHIPTYSVFMYLTKYFNHSINGLVYCIVGSRFRKELLKVVCGKERPKPVFTSQSIKNTSLTNICGGRN